MVFRAFLLSIGQLGDRAILSVLAKSLAVTIALFALLGVGGYFLIQAGIDRAAGAHGSTGIAALLALLLGIGAAWLLFRIVAIAVVGLFADAVVAAVEGRYYPAALAGARTVAPGRALRMGLGSAARALAINLAMTPVYIVLLVTGIGTAIAFFAVNGWLLGRDLGDMVAARHMDDATMRRWRGASAGRRFALGLAATALFVVPFVNILAPVVGAAMATHLFHGGKT